MALDIDRYAHIVSPIQQWDVRYKIACLGLLIFVLASVQSLPVAVMGLFLAALFLLITTLPLHFVWHGISFVLIFLLPFFLVMPFAYPGEGAFKILGLGFSWEGFRLAAIIFMKALAVVITSFTIFGTSRFDVSMYAMQRLKAPKMIVQMLLFTYRYTFVFLEEMQRMYVSMKARGFVAKVDGRTLTIMGHFVGTLIVRSFERTDRVYKAMLSKGYQGELHTMVEFKSGASDVIKGVVILVLAAGILYLDLSGIFTPAEQGWY